ncbi:unnamed protein product [Amoebophrya sp. A25]|nr:unnamed protein product [Amoebophrya sp. A25]|eukprot:GSA25T00023675001.1
MDSGGDPSIGGPVVRKNKRGSFSTTQRNRKVPDSTFSTDQEVFSDGTNAASSVLPSLRLEDAQIAEHYISGVAVDVPQRYSVSADVPILGAGAYGVVYAAVDRHTGNKKAIKKIENVFEHLQTARRTLRELRLLRYLRGHENLLNPEAVYFAPDAQAFEHLYLVTDCVDTDLGNLLRRRDLRMEQTHHMFLLYQCLRGLKFMHSACVMHRDLKPKNLLVSTNWDLVICDFGLAKILPEKSPHTNTEGLGSEAVLGDESDPDAVMTQYVCSRYYRAPEVLCEKRSYDYAIDMWALGCIWAEMISTGNICFLGNNTQGVLRSIIRELGGPPVGWLDDVSSEKCKAFVMQCAAELPPATEMQLHWDYANTGPEHDVEAATTALDLLRMLLRWEPEQRLTAWGALKHPFLSTLHCEEEEPVWSRDSVDSLRLRVENGAASFADPHAREGSSSFANSAPSDALPVPPIDFAFDSRELGETELRLELMREAASYYPHDCWRCYFAPDPTPGEQAVREFEVLSLPPYSRKKSRSKTRRKVSNTPLLKGVLSVWQFALTSGESASSFSTTSSGENHNGNENHTLASCSSHSAEAVASTSSSSSSSASDVATSTPHHLSGGRSVASLTLVDSQATVELFQNGMLTFAAESQGCTGSLDLRLCKMQLGIPTQCMHAMPQQQGLTFFALVRDGGSSTVSTGRSEISSREGGDNEDQGGARNNFSEDEQQDTILVFALESAEMRKMWVKRVGKFTIEEELAHQRPVNAKQKQRTRLSVVESSSSSQSVAAARDALLKSGGNSFVEAASGKAAPADSVTTVLLKQEMAACGHGDTSSASGSSSSSASTSNSFSESEEPSWGQQRAAAAGGKQRRGSMVQRRMSVEMLVAQMEALTLAGGRRAQGSESLKHGGSSRTDSATGSDPSVKQQQNTMSTTSMPNDVQGPDTANFLQAHLQDMKNQAGISASVDRVAPPSQVSPGCRNRRNSQLEFSNANQTIVVFDWDDTLYPTTWVRNDFQLSYKYPLDWQLSEPMLSTVKAKLAQFEAESELLLRHAATHAEVLIVTLAKRPWIDMSVEHLTPKLGQVVRELKIPMLYAQEFSHLAEGETREQQYAYMKGLAIASGVDRFYSQYAGQTWKNVISVGDSDFERMGTQAAIRDYYLRFLQKNAGLSPVRLTSADQQNFMPTLLQDDDGQQQEHQGDDNLGSATQAAGGNKTKDPNSPTAFGVLPTSSLARSAAGTSGEQYSMTSQIEMDFDNPLPVISLEPLDEEDEAAGQNAHAAGAQSKSLLFADDFDEAPDELSVTRTSSKASSRSTSRAGSKHASARRGSGGMEAIPDVQEDQVQFTPPKPKTKGFVRSPVDGRTMRVRCKTVKLLEEPTVEELLAQVSLVRIWLRPLILMNRGVDLRLSTSEHDEEIQQIHALLTGTTPSTDLNWVHLSGLSEP